ncbi:Gfo/Idh/MocA family protein [Halobacillus sp. H74]|uniref:Gfo/Idh/MocA family protein n=1 Tax=Halobacillus sp. H74 TaxID=3457436 RepID=UPI003FCC2F8C
MLRVALLSRWHVHADDYAAEASAHPLVSIDKVWDEDAERGKSWADELGVPFEDDVSSIFHDPDIDAIILTSSTARHHDLLVEAAKYGKHIFTEKVLTLTKNDGEEVLTAVAEAQVKFMISMPRLTADYYLYAQKMMDQGVLGQVNMIRCRVAHNGAVPNEQHSTGWLPERFFDAEQCGGGSLVDLGAHPIYLANRLAGKPQYVSARLHSLMGLGVDDHAAVTVEYDSGILSVLETSFISTGSPFQLELYGTEGTLLIESDQIRVKSEKHGLEKWTTPDELPLPLETPFEQWVKEIIDGTPPSITVKDAQDLTLVNEAAAISHQEGCRVEIKA